MERDVCLDMIISLIQAHETGEDSVVSGPTCLRAAHYLLGQIVRQYSIPAENRYISSAAKALWEKLSDENIWEYVYVDKFVCKRDCVLPRFVGAEKEAREKTKAYKKGDKIEFKSVFHDEHIISVQVILQQLYALKGKDLNYENVRKILDSIVICRILKEEDKRLSHKRYATFEENYEEIYKPNQVFLESASAEYLKKKRKDF